MSDVADRIDLACTIRDVFQDAHSGMKQAEYDEMFCGVQVLVDCAAEIIAAGWRAPVRTIETEEELEELPDGSVVLDRQHDVAEKHSGRLLYRETRNMPLEYLAKHYGPFTVLWEPEADDE